MLIDYCDNPEYADVLLRSINIYFSLIINIQIYDTKFRLLVNLTNPALLLYKEELPKDGPGRRNFLDLIDILQGYKEAFTRQSIWAVLGARLQKVLEIVCIPFIYMNFVYRMEAWGMNTDSIK